MSNDYTALRKSMPEVVKQLQNKVDGTVYTVENAIRTYLWNKAGYEVPGMSKRDVKLLDNFDEAQASIPIIPGKISAQIGDPCLDSEYPIIRPFSHSNLYAPPIADTSDVPS